MFCKDYFLTHNRNLNRSAPKEASREHDYDYDCAYTPPNILSTNETKWRD